VDNAVKLSLLTLTASSHFVDAHVLIFFGVSLPVVQVGGGLIVVAMGFGCPAEKMKP